MQKDQINVNEHGHKPSLKLLDRLSDRLRVKGQLARRRVRMCYWKQWHKTRTKVRELLKLSTSLNAAISVGLSWKGYWRLSRTLATQTGMTNLWLEKQGLVSIKKLWVNGVGAMGEKLPLTRLGIFLK